MKNIVYIFCFLFICSLNFACRDKNEKIAHTVNEWMGKEVIFSQNVKLYSRLNDTIKFDDILTKDFKILFYVNSSECFKCKARLADWNKLIFKFNQLYQSKVGFL